MASAPPANPADPAFAGNGRTSNRVPPMKLPDFEAWAVFAKVAETGSFVGGRRQQLNLSKATVSKAVTRLETRLGATLFHRTSRRLSLTESSGAPRWIAPATSWRRARRWRPRPRPRRHTPRGLVRRGRADVVRHRPSGVRPCRNSSPSIPRCRSELSLSDQLVDIVDEGFRSGVAISALEDSSLLARRLCPVRVMLVGSPDYFDRHGRPEHPKDLTAHRGLFYTGGRSKDVWRFQHAEYGQYAGQACPRPCGSTTATSCARAAGGRGLGPAAGLPGRTGRARRARWKRFWPTGPRRRSPCTLVTPPSTIRPAAGGGA